MKTPAEELWSGKTRGLLEFERIAPTNGLSMGAIGVVAGSKGAATFYSYLKQPAVMARLEAEGFVRGDKGTLLHPWYLPLGPGVVSPCDKALKRSKQLRLRQEVAALHVELSDGTMTAAMDKAMADHGAHYPNTRPCSICGYGDDSGTIRHCDSCNEPFHVKIQYIHAYHGLNPHGTRDARTLVARRLPIQNPTHHITRDRTKTVKREPVRALLR